MKSGIINKDKNYSLHDTENYKKELVCTVSDVTSKYSLLIIEYFKFIQENIKVSSNINLSKFIIIRGLDTITNVFLHILYYTKNVDLTYFHCQKSFYFYVEFVGQISDDEKMFLQLTSRDATTYVYKKTIFDIHNECKKTMNENISHETKDKLVVINNYVNMYKTFIYKIINNNNNIVNLNIEVFEKICIKTNKNILDKENIIVLNVIFDKFYFIINDINYYFEVIQEFLKKYKLIHLKNYEKKLYTEEIFEKLNYSPDKFISWLLN